MSVILLCLKPKNSSHVSFYFSTTEISNNLKKHHLVEFFKVTPSTLKSGLVIVKQFQIWAKFI